jgi:nucleoside-diphosphate-sugar epimerase/predicted dehydrogenase
MIAAASQAGKRLMVNHSARFEPPVAQALDLLKQGAIGDPLALHLFRGSDYPPYAGGPMPAVFRQGSYPFRDLGVHALYLIEAFLGPIQSLDVRHHSTGRDPLLTYDEWRATAVASNGATGHIMLSWNMQPVQNEMWLHGTRGTLHIDCFLQSCTLYRAYPGPKQLHAIINGTRTGLQRLFGSPMTLVGFATGRIKPSPGIYAAVRAFYQAIADNAPVPVPTDEGRNAVRWVTAASIAPDADKDALEAQRTQPQPPAAILVTGAAGFLGAKLVARLVAEGHQPRLFLRRPLPSHSPLAHLPAVIGDLGNPADVERAVSGTKLIYHVGAAMKGPPEAFKSGTVHGTRNILDACRRHQVSRLVYVSSMGVLDHAGHADGVFVTEKSPVEPFPEQRGAYTQTKLEAEHLVRDSGLPAVIIRPGQIFGPGAETVTPNGVIKLAGRWIVCGNGSRKLPLVHVDDVIDALLLAAHAPNAIGQTINLVDPTPVDQNRYLDYIKPKAPILRVPEWFLMLAASGVELLGKILKRQVPLTRYRVKSLKPLHPFDIKQAQQTLNWAPKVQPFK